MVDVELIQALVHEAVKKETENLKKETEALKGEVKALKDENEKLKNMVTKLDRGLDELDQYGRKTSLILGGAFPEGEEWEDPSKTRETTMKVIKEQLKVDLKGGVAACHRLRNGKRVIVKFNDLQDRDAVYQAKFEQEAQGGDKVTVHENLTEKRAKMVTFLEELRKEKILVNYHTRNGNIMARSSTTKKYARIQTWFTRDDIISATENAPEKKATQQFTNSKFMRSQSLKNLPQGHVATHKADLEQFVVQSKPRQVRQKKESK